MRGALATVLASIVVSACGGLGPVHAGDCDHPCLEHIADQYRAAYLKHDPALAPIAKSVRFSENGVEMLQFPDASWDTVTQEAGPALTFSDPASGSVGIYTQILQNDTPGFLGIRLRVSNRQIVEIEHMLSTARNLSSPPTPIGKLHTDNYDPGFTAVIPANERVPRAQLISLANGYFDTLQKNNGEIRNTRFSPDATRYENGMKFSAIEQGFRSGRYLFNERVRDRDFFLVDEERGIVMSRAFIDHKGVLDEYRLTDGTPQRSVFREPQTWALLEAFKIRGGMIVSVEASFIQVPYYMRSPWTKKPDLR
jgi:hypothetical protein